MKKLIATSLIALTLIAGVTINSAEARKIYNQEQFHLRETDSSPDTYGTMITRIIVPNGTSSFDSATGAVTLNTAGIGAVVTSGTNGSVLFLDGGASAAAITQDNLSFYFDNDNNRLGLNDTTPDALLDVNGAAIVSSTLAAGATTITGALSVSTTSTLTGSIKAAVRTVTTTDTASCTADFHMNMNGSTGFTQALPTASSCSGTIFVYNLINNGSAQTVTIDADASELIDSATTATLTLTNETLRIQSNGTKWFRW